MSIRCFSTLLLFSQLSLSIIKAILTGFAELEADVETIDETNQYILVYLYLSEKHMLKCTKNTLIYSNPNVKLVAINGHQK